MVGIGIWLESVLDFSAAVKRHRTGCGFLCQRRIAARWSIQISVKCMPNGLLRGSTGLATKAVTKPALLKDSKRVEKPRIEPGAKNCLRAASR